MADRILELFLSLPPLLFALTVHEYFHGFVAYKMGDPTARLYGRLTLNPLRHIDIIGFIVFLLFRFGWARPVPINPYNFKDIKKGIISTALAGPISNFILALLFGIALRLFKHIDQAFAPIYLMLQLGVIYNLILCAFNLIPIPPLDGSKVLFNLLPARYEYTKFWLERYGVIVLLGMIFIDNLGIPILWGWIGPFIKIFGNLFVGSLVF